MTIEQKKLGAEKQDGNVEYQRVEQEAEKAISGFRTVRTTNAAISTPRSFRHQDRLDPLAGECLSSI